MSRFSVVDAKNTLPRLIDRARGEEVVITRHGEPVVELRPASPARRAGPVTTSACCRRAAAPARVSH